MPDKLRIMTHEMIDGFRVKCQELQNRQWHLRYYLYATNIICIRIGKPLQTPIGSGQGDAMAGCHRSDLVFDITIECCKGDGRVLLSLDQGCRIKRPFVSTVAKLERTPFMLCWEDNDKGTEHLAMAGCVLVRFEERSLA